MEHNGGNENMENLPSTLCRTGCGFYASAAFEGMCSKCFKDAVKRRQQNSSPTPMGGRTSPTASSLAATSIAATSTPAATTTTTSTTSPSSVLTTTADVATATPTVPSPCPAGDRDKDSAATTTTTTTAHRASTATVDKSPEGATASAACSPNDKEKKPKKNRCHTCKKKVGLTGFECRCGGLYCSMHRYSDKHDCSFNYKELAQQQIRKNNPVVVGQKIQKI